MGRKQRNNGGGGHGSSAGRGGRRRRLDPEEAVALEAVARHKAAILRPDGPLEPPEGAGADSCELEVMDAEQVANVWGGVGTVSEVRGLARWKGAGASDDVRLIVKHVKMGHCTSEGDRRKKASYNIEAHFYERRHAAALRAAGARCPSLGFVERHAGGEELILCMSKLEGMPARRMSPAMTDAALEWLATLHASYWGKRADRAVEEGGLQSQGCYWYLDTRLKELKQMPTDGWQGRLRRLARGLDARLKEDPHQTVVHGDAKTENMLFMNEGGNISVGFFDFQYVGKAHPAKDLAYCSLGVHQEPDAEADAKYLIKYLSFLAPLLKKQGDVPPTFDELRAAYFLSLLDLARWMSGWGWVGFEPQMRRRCKATLEAIDGGKDLGSEEAYVEALARVFPLPKPPSPKVGA